MCGMAGAYCPTHLSSFEIKKLQKLLVLNHWRGDDSVGMFDYINKPKGKKTDDLLYWKTVEHPIRFAYGTFEKQLNTRWKEESVNAIAVHCRAATIGEVTKANAHPFYFPNVIGMHNGTITREFEGKDKYGTDSEAIYALLNEMPFDKAIKEVGYGAYALVWMDFRDNSLNFYRNNQRPLHGFVAGTNTLYWSSDILDLCYTMQHRDAMDVLKSSASGKEEFKKNSVFEFPVNEHVKIEMAKSEFSYTTETVYHYTSTPVTHYNYQRRAEDWNQDFFQKRHSGPTTTLADPLIEKIKKTAEKQKKTVTFEWFNPSGKLHGVDHVDRIGKPTADIWNTRYAIEFNKWYSRETYGQVQHFRAEYPKAFTERLQRTFMMLTKEDQVKALGFAGLSRNMLKRLLSFKDLSYVFIPYHLNALGEKVYNEYIIRTYRTRSAWFTTEPVEDAAFTVIEGGKDSLFTIGVNKRPVSKQDYINYLRTHHCAHCGDPISEREDLFWLDHADYICEGCQEGAVEQGRHHLLFQLFTNIQPDEIKRHVEARNPIRNVG